MIKLSGYKIIKKLGSGGMGDVYLAEHEKLAKKVAIKSLHKNLVTDTNFRERFSQEAKTHSKLDHSNIVKLLDYKESIDGLFLIMDYVDGKQLDEHVKKVTGPIPEKELASLFTQILDAIGYAHMKGLVHRDIKPSNIMIDKEGRIKLLDFGIAKMQDEEQGLTKTGVQIGTAAFMSPEQVNAKKVDKLSDIYSLGVTLYYMAVGKSPYDGETNTFSIQTKIVSDPLPTPSDIYPGVSKKLEAIISKATQKDKKHRYQSCDDLKKDINSKNLVITKEFQTSTPKQLEKNKKNSKLNPIISVLLLFVVIGSVGFYYNYQTELETQKQEIEELRLEKEKIEEGARKAEEKRKAAEEKRKEEEAKKAEEKRKAEEARLVNSNSRVGCIYGDCQNGQGTYTWADGEKYVGEWRYGARNGYGTYTWANGEKYVGEFNNSKLHGQGTYTWASGNKYFGEWRDGERTGYGTFTWPSGHKYVGNFLESNKDGQGIYTWPNGDKYIGEWRNDNRTGFGTFTWAIGDKYVGNFEDGKLNGFGTLTYSNGDKYLGEWINNKKHGQGTYIWADGSKRVGEWRDGKYINK